MKLENRTIFLILLLGSLDSTFSSSVTNPDPVSLANYSLITTASMRIPRQLEVDQQDQLDDQALYGQSNLSTSQSLSAQLVMTTLDQSPLNFNEKIENIESQLNAVRNSIDTTIQNSVRVSALNAYISNAVLMSQLGLLDNTDDESLINTNVNSLLPSRKVVRKLRKSNHRSLHVHRHGKQFRMADTIRRRRRMRLYAPRSRRLMKVNRMVKTKQVMSSKGHVERSLRDGDYQNKVARKGFIHKPQNYHMSQIAKLREDDELLELAKTGNLFKLDLGSVYDVSNEDMQKYMIKDESKKPKSI